MDDQKPASERLGSKGLPDPQADPAPQSTAGTPKPQIGEGAIRRTGNQLWQKADALSAEASEKAKGFFGDQVEAGADLLGHIGRSATAAADTLEADAPQ